MRWTGREQRRAAWRLATAPTPSTSGSRAKVPSEHCGQPLCKGLGFGSVQEESPISLFSALRSGILLRCRHGRN